MVTLNITGKPGCVFRESEIVAWVKNFPKTSAGAQRWTNRGQPRGGFVGITTNMFDAVEEFLQDFRHSMLNWQYGEQALVMLLAKTSQGFAQQMSRGPNVGPSGGSQMELTGRRFVVDSSGTATPSPQWRGQAWRIPVRRITSRYYQGWKVRRIAPNIWELYNESREAYFIEFGIHPTSPYRVRRPVRKMAALKTIRFAQQTKAGHRILDSVFGNPPGTQAGIAYYTRLFPQSPGVMPVI